MNGMAISRRLAALASRPRAIQVTVRTQNSADTRVMLRVVDGAECVLAILQSPGRQSTDVLCGRECIDRAIHTPLPCRNRRIFSGLHMIVVEPKLLH